ncbi:MAG: YybH family protein [Burkholderiales bacterium]
MLKRILGSITLVTLLAAPAFADPAAVGKKHSEAFQKACAAGDVPGVMALYEDDALVIWPGEGEVAKGKAAIEKLAAATCKQNVKLKLKSQESRAIGEDYIVNVGRWDNTAPGPNGKPMTAEIRTTELLHRSGGKWRYSVDHASVGVPAPSGATSK